MSDHLYSSIQIDFNDNISKIFLERARTLVNEEHLHDSKHHLGFEKNPHITVLYGIHDIEPTDDLIQLIEEYPKFSLTLGNISLFKANETDNKFDVVKVEVDDANLHILNELFSNRLEFTSDFPEFIPHATIAYVKPDIYDHLIGDESFQGLNFSVDFLSYCGKNEEKQKLYLNHNN